MRMSYNIGKISNNIKKFGLKETMACVFYNMGIVEKYTYQKLRIPYYSTLDMVGRKCELEEWYFDKTGERLNLEEPQNFNQKIQWLKLYDSTELKTKLADKYLVREWVKEKVGEEVLVPLLGVWSSYDEIEFDRLPDKFVLKANHGCGMNLIIKDKQSIDYKVMKTKINSWMQYTFGWDGMQLQYVNIPKKIIAEEFIEQMDGNLYDYKIHCFNGIPKFIQVMTDRVLNEHLFNQSYYDVEWNKVDFVFNVRNKMHHKEIPKPSKLKEMLYIAEQLSKEFVYVRVDLYLIENQIKFGELTFTPASGTSKWDSKESNELVGSWIDISPIKERMKNEQEDEIRTS